MYGFCRISCGSFGGNTTKNRQSESSNKYAKLNTSLDMQENTIIKLFPKIKTIIKCISGAYHKTSDDLISLLRLKKTKIIFYSVDRFSRNISSGVDLVRKFMKNDNTLIFIRENITLNKESVPENILNNKSRNKRQISQKQVNRRSVSQKQVNRRSVSRRRILMDLTNQDDQENLSGTGDQDNTSDLDDQNNSSDLDDRDNSSDSDAQENSSDLDNIQLHLSNYNSRHWREFIMCLYSAYTESKNIGERVSASIKYRTDRGYYVGNKPPIGYKKVQTFGGCILNIDLNMLYIKKFVDACRTKDSSVDLLNRYLMTCGADIVNYPLTFDDNAKTIRDDLTYKNIAELLNDYNLGQRNWNANAVARLHRADFSAFDKKRKSNVLDTPLRRKTAAPSTRKTAASSTRKTAASSTRKTAASSPNRRQISIHSNKRKLSDDLCDNGVDDDVDKKSKIIYAHKRRRIERIPNIIIPVLQPRSDNLDDQADDEAEEVEADDEAGEADEKQEEKIVGKDDDETENQMYATNDTKKRKSNTTRASSMLKKRKHY
jgi:hypothetical protein